MTRRVDMRALDGFRQSLILGTHRAASGPPSSLVELLPPGLEPEGQLLGALALLGQHDRLTRRFSVVQVPPERRLEADAIVPDAVRPSVRHLLATAEAVVPTLEQLAKVGLRLHPFDIAGLAGHVEAHAALLHPADREALRLKVDDASPEEDWRVLGPKAMGRHFAQWRRTDPAAAREALAPVFAELEANARREAIATFVYELSEADRSFLEAVASDRSKTVRQHVEGMLGTFSGTEVHQKRLLRLAEDLTVSKRKLRGLSIGIARGLDAARVVEASRGLRLGDLLTVLQIDRAAFVKSRPHIAAPLEAVFLEAAMRDNDGEVVEGLAREASVDWARFLTAASPSLSRAALVDHLPRLPVRTAASKRTAVDDLVVELGDRLGRPWPAAIARALLQGIGGAHLIFPMTVVLPYEVLSQWVGRLPQEHPVRGDPWLAFLEHLSSVPNEAPEAPGAQ